MSKNSSTRARILQGGTDRLSISGLSGITVGVLAEQTGMSKSGFFAHFGSKEELQIELLEHTARIGREHIVAPAMAVEEGLQRLKALVRNWLGWAARAGLPGGCPVAAGFFEMDDSEGPVRDRLSQLDAEWRAILAGQVARAVELGQLRHNLDVEQLVWELCGIYLSHHVSSRFVKDASSDRRARVAFDALLERALPQGAGQKEW